MKFNKASAAILMALIAGLLITGNVFAHALLVRSLPVANSELAQPPTKIEMWFSEPLEAGFSSARLLNSSGIEIPVGAAELDPNDPTHLSVSLGQLSPGIYTVAWKTLSRTDGHEWYGSFPFTILNSDGSRPEGTATVPNLETQTELPTLPQTVSRWLSLMGGILFLSVPLFFIFVTPGMTGSGEASQLEARLNALAIRVIVLAVLAIVIGSCVQIALQAIRLDSVALLPRLVYGTHTGALALTRQALSLLGFLMIPVLMQPSTLSGSKLWIVIAGAVFEICLLLLILISGFQGEGVVAFLALATVAIVSGLMWQKQLDRVPIKRPPWNLLLVLGLVTLFYFSIGGHAGAVPGSFWAILSDYIHLLASSAWIGGLLLLPLALETIRGYSSPSERSMLGKLFRRYGYMAKLSFFLLITTGVFNSLVQFPTFISIINTSYGRVLLVKLLLVFAVWEISLLSSRILRRKADPSHFTTNLQKFIQQVSLAALIGLVLMISVSILVQTQPPGNLTANLQTPDFSYHNVVQADDLLIHVQVTPNQVGNNQFYIQLNHKDDTPIGDVQLVRLLFNYEEAQIGQANADLNQIGTNVFGIEGAYLNQPGAWKVSVYVRRRGVDDIVADLHVKVPGPADIVQRPDPFQNPVSTIPVNGILAGSMIIAAVEIFRWRGTLKQVQPHFFYIFMITAGIFIVLGIIIGLPLAMSF
jgi:copper transport protein